MTLKQMIIDDAQEGGVFFPEDSSGDPVDFDERHTFYPKYDADQKVENVPCHVFMQDLEGSREVIGDGRVINRPNSRGVRQTIKVRVPTGSVTIQTVQSRDCCDVWEINSVLYNVKTILSTDPGMTTMLCVRRGFEAIRNESRVG